MSKYLLLFGNTPELSRFELESVYPDLEFNVIETGELKNRLVILDLNVEQISPMMKRLGGLVKIFKLETEWKVSLTAKDLEAKLADLLLEFDQDPYFTVYQHGKGQKAVKNARIKAVLRELGHKSRFFQGNLEASALFLHHPESLEIFLYHQEDKILVARLVATQDIDDWTKKDRQKPYFDRKKGMLPPKVARMMTNVALGQWQKKNSAKALLYDPFCGTGTVLIEALQLGCSVYGSDLDEKAVFGTRDNLDWLVKEYGVKTDAWQKNIFYADVGQLSVDKFEQKVDLLVTEPYLGRQTPKEDELANIFKGLEKMYLGAFKNFAKILNPGAMVFIIFPKVMGQNKTFSLRKLIDKLALKGYNLTVNPLLYAREGARVQREIYLFEFQGKETK